MAEELEALDETYTWDLFPFPADKKPIGRKGCRKSRPTMKCYKAYLVAKGYSREYGIDYDETIALIVKITKI